MRSYLKEKVAAAVYKTKISGRGEPLRWPCYTPVSEKVGAKIHRPPAVVVGVVCLQSKIHGVCFYHSLFESLKPRRSSILLYTVQTEVKKNGVFWVVTPCGSCKNRRFGGTWRLLHQKKNKLRGP
jgi:hypothetical protein